MSWKGGAGGAFGAKGSSKGNVGGSIKPVIKPVTGAKAGVAASKPEAKANGAVSKPAADNGKKPQYVVSTKSESDEIGIQTLLGEYSEVSTNHGKKVFQKMGDIPGHKDVKVLLYYWDNRDGAEFSGWWFGDEVGGTQVWARCPAHGMIPPKVGWKIPWDAEKATPGVLLVEPYVAAATAPAAKASLAPAAKGAVAAKIGSVVPARVGAGAAAGAGAASPAKAGAASPAKAGAAAPPAAVVERVKKATASVEAAEKEAKQALLKVKGLNAQSEEDTLSEMLELVTAQQAALNECLKSLTQDINETRKAGPSAVSSVTDLSKLSPRLRTQITSITAEVNKIKGFQRAAANNKKNDADLAGKEEEHAAALAAALPEVKEKVSSIEDNAEAVHIMASPLVEDPPDEPGEASLRAMEEIETSANEAQDMLAEARKLVNTKLQAARAYAPEARKAALAEYNALNEKLGEAQKKINPYKNFKKEFQQRVEAKKALADLVDKLAEAELEVEKASMMSAAADQGQMSEDEVVSTEEIIKPALEGINGVAKIIETKMKGATGPMKDELVLMKSRLMDSRKKLDGISQVLKRQREGLVLQKMAGEAAEKVDAAEESLNLTQEAEMPFLKGIEVLPQEESAKAIEDSEKAAAESGKVIEVARGFIKQKLLECKRYGQESAKQVIEELKELQQRAEEVQKKLNSFKSDTVDRKIAAVMSEVLDSVTTAERKGKELAEATSVFAVEVLDDVKADELRAAGDKAAAIDKEVTGALAEAKKQVAAKQKESKTPDMAQSLSKINARLNAVSGEQMKAKKAASTAQQLIKGKEILVAEEEKVKAAEADVEKAEECAKVEEGETQTDESVKEMETAMTNASKAMKATQGVLSPLLPGTVPLVKAPMQELMDRCKAGISKMEKLKVATKGVREKVMADVYVKEGKALADEVEAAMNKVGDAELPFLMGTESIPLSESTAAMVASEAAATEVTTAINNARSFLAAKNIEVKGFKSDNAKTSLEEFAKVMERINGEANKLSQFKKDTEQRKKAMQVQEAGEKLNVLEAEVEKVTEASKPFGEEQTEDVDLLEQWKSLSAIEKDAKTKSDELKTLLSSIQKDSTGNAEKKKVWSEMNERLQKQLQELMKVRKLVSSHEQKFKAKALMEEATTMIKDMEDEVTKATEFCAPLLEQGGERFLVGNRVSVITLALKELMAEKELDIEALLTEVNGGAAGNVPKDKFVAYLAALPEKLSKEELQLSEERQAAVFEQIDLDKDGEVSVSDFKEACKKTYSCVEAVSLTESLDMASKTLLKLAGGEVLESYSAPKKETPEGAPRVQVKVVDSDKEGWVTIQGTGGGKTFLQEKSAFKDWCAEVDVKLAETQKFNSKVSTFFNAKQKELQTSGGSGPLATAKTELAKLKSTVTKAQMDVDALKKKMIAAKKTHAVNEQKEANAHIEAKERKEADAIMEPARTSMALLDKELKRLEEVASPLISLTGDDLLAFAGPVAIRDEIKGIVAAATEAAGETKTKAKAAAEELPKAAQGPMAEGHKELTTMTANAGKATVSASKTQTDVKKACDAIADNWLKKAAIAMREDMLKNSVSLDDLWTKIAGVGMDSISEDDFCKHLVSLEGVTVALEHATLVAQKLGAGSISRRAFQGMVQLFYIAVKEIAITTSFDVDTKEKPVRRAEVDELFEVLEGPQKDDKIGLERVKVRSMNDHVEGWVSVKGNNQGKVFLQETTKPFYTCIKDTPLASEFTTGSEKVRDVKADEVLELLEGPRKEVLKNALRVRGKASGDGKMGWITVRDTAGNDLAVKDGKMYTCTATVAMTDDFDIKTCKVVKKLAVDEVFTMIEAAREDETSKITRIKGKSTKDGAEGWITVKGNAGSSYAKVNEKLWSIVADEVPLHNQFATKGATTVKTLSKDDGMEVLEGPKEEKVAPVTRVKCRTSGDGAVGWMNLDTDFLKSWSGSYKVLKALPMHQSKSSDMAAELGDAGVVRELAAGEELDLVEGPMEEGDEMRAKCRAKSDGVSGWVSFKDKEGKRLLQ